MISRSCQYAILNSVFDPLGTTCPVKEEFNFNLENQAYARVSQVAGKALVTFVTSLVTFSTKSNLSQGFLLSREKKGMQPSTLTWTPEEFITMSKNGTFPKGREVHVSGDLILGYCTGLISLPESLSVDGDLTVGINDSLTSLPKSLVVSGNLKIDECKNLASLSDDLFVGGNLSLRRSPKLTSIGYTVHVEGNLSLWSGLNLKSIGNSLSVRGKMELTKCEFTETIAKKLFVGGDLNIKQSRLNSLPENLSIGGNLCIVESDLTSLPNGLSVGGNLEIRLSPGLKSIGNDVSVGGRMNLIECASLGSIGNNLRVEKYLLLWQCQKLLFIGDNVFVGENLSLSSGGLLKTIGNNLHVGRDLEIENGFRYLTSIGNPLFVGGDLRLRGCRGLTSLPNNFYVQGNINLGSCPGLTSLPNVISELGLKKDGKTRNIDLWDTGLSHEVIRRLQASDHPGIQFYFSKRAKQSPHQFSSLDEGLQFWAEIANVKSTPLLELRYHSDFVLAYLGSLTTTADYKNQKTRFLLATRVMDVFKKMSSEPRIKEKAAVVIFNELTGYRGCFISALKEIELMIHVHEIEKGDSLEEDLKELGRGFLALEKVNAKARDYILSLRWVDEVEVYLAFQIGLAERFSLPVKTISNISASFAQVTDQQIKELGEEVESDLTEVALAGFLKTWSPWQKFKRKSEIPLFNDLPIESSVMLEEDDICMLTLRKPEKPVFYQSNIYDYEGFCEQYEENGNDPANPNDVIDISLLKRIFE